MALASTAGRRCHSRIPILAVLAKPRHVVARTCRRAGGNTHGHAPTSPERSPSRSKTTLTTVTGFPRLDTGYKLVRERCCIGAAGQRNHVLPRRGQTVAERYSDAAVIVPRAGAVASASAETLRHSATGICG